MFSNPSQTFGFATKFIRVGEEITDTFFENKYLLTLAI